GDGIREQHDFDIQDVTIKGQLNINRNHSVIAKYTRFEEASLFSETGLTAQEYRANPYSVPGSEGERYDMERDTLQLIHRWDLGEGARLTTQIYHTKSDRQSRRAREFEPDDAALGHGEFEPNDFAIRPRQYTVQGIEPKLEFTHTALGIPSEAIIGMRYHTEDIDRKKFELDALYGNVTTADERLLANIDATAFYAQNTFLAGDWTFTPGLRVERIEQSKTLFAADAVDPLQFAQADSLQTSKTQTLPGFGFTWNGLTDSTVFGGIHRGFAPPRPDRDIGANAMGMVQLQNVTPELATVSELGIRSNTRAGSWEATLFNMDIEDLVVQAGGVFRNEGKAQHTGFELAGRFNLGELFVQKSNPFFVSMAYTNLFTAKFKNSGEVGGEGEDGYGEYAAGNRLPYAPKHTLALNLSYETSQWNARLGATHLSKQFANTENLPGTGPEGFCPAGDDPANDLFCGVYGEIEAVTLLNATVRYQPVGSSVSYFLNAENLTDKQYIATRTNGIHPGRQRQVVAGVHIKF
ncbi:MAG TPA: TonB-dependent receptor, partial [Limnobacter sp.]|nr:TonB-dependent receptor [Limnobacter sp.]